MNKIDYVSEDNLRHEEKLVVPDVFPRFDFVDVVGHQLDEMLPDKVVDTPGNPGDLVPVTVSIRVIPVIADNGLDFVQNGICRENGKSETLDCIPGID